MAKLTGARPDPCRRDRPRGFIGSLGPAKAIAALGVDKRVALAQPAGGRYWGEFNPGEDDEVDDGNAQIAVSPDGSANGSNRPVCRRCLLVGAKIKQTMRKLQELSIEWRKERRREGISIRFRPNWPSDATWRASGTPACARMSRTALSHDGGGHRLDAEDGEGAAQIVASCAVRLELGAHIGVRPRIRKKP